MEQELRNMMREEAQGLLQPVLQAQEQQRREEKIRALAEQFPRIREFATEIDAELSSLAQRYGNPFLRTDPELLLRVYKSLEADAAASGQTPAEAGSRGAVLEQGGAPAAPEPERSPVEQQYDQVFATPAGADPFTQ